MMSNIKRKKIWLCLAHMSEAGEEMKFIKEAFDTNWVVPLGPNVNGFEALGLARWFSPDDILISEEFGHSKPSMECYQYFLDRYPDTEFVVIGDNPAKDFITPNKLGWTTICLCSNGQNIHDQNLEVEKNYLPKHSINNLSEIKRFC